VSRRRWPVVGVKQSEAPPTDRCKPRPGCDDRWPSLHRLDRNPPAL